MVTAKETPPPMDWYRIPSTAENSRSTYMAILGWGGLLQRVEFQGTEWPPKRPVFPDEILYANITNPSFLDPEDSKIPPQAIGKSFKMPRIGLGIPSGPSFGPVRIHGDVYLISDDQKQKISNIDSELVIDPSKPLLGFEPPISLEDSKNLAKLLASPSPRVTIQVIGKVFCLQPYAYAPLGKTWLGAIKTDWFWVETAQIDKSFNFELLKPEILLTGSRILDEFGDLLDSLPGGDIQAIPGKLYSLIADYVPKLPPLPPWLEKQGIEDTVEAYVGRLDFDGKIQRVAVDLKLNIEGQVKSAGIQLIQLIHDREISVRQDITAVTTRLRQQFEDLVSVIEPLKKRVGEILTRKEIEDIVAKKIASLLAEITPPSPKAKIGSIGGNRVVSEVGKTANLVVPVTVSELGTYRMKGVFEEQKLSPGFPYNFKFSKVVDQERVDVEFTLEGLSPDGKWETLSLASTTIMVVKAILTTTDPPVLFFLYRAPNIVPALLPNAQIGEFAIGLRHKDKAPGLNLEWAYLININSSTLYPDIAYAVHNGWLKVKDPSGTFEDGSYLFEDKFWDRFPTDHFPPEEQKIRVKIQPAVYNILTKEFSLFPLTNPKSIIDKEFSLRVLYPNPKIVAALKPPIEAIPGIEFPVTFIWDNQTSVSGPVKIAGISYTALEGKNSTSLVSVFPDKDINAVEYAFKAEAIGPGGGMRVTDEVKYKSWRMSPSARILSLDPPSIIKPSTAFSFPVDFEISGLPSNKSIPVRITLGEKELAKGSASNGRFRLAPSITMPFSPLSGSLSLQILDNIHNEGEQWQTKDIAGLFVLPSTPLPVITASLPSEVPVGESVSGTINLQNLGQEGRVEVKFAQKSVLERGMSAGESIQSQVKLDSAIWDDTQIAIAARSDAGVQTSSALVRAVTPTTTRAVLTGAQRLRAGEKSVYTAEVKNIGSLGIIGVEFNSIQQLDRTATGVVSRFSYDYTMPGEEFGEIAAKSFHVGRLQTVYYNDEVRIKVLPKDTLYIDKRARMYGEPGMRVVGAVVGKGVFTKGLRVPVDGFQPLPFIFETTFRDYEFFDITYDDLEMLFIKSTGPMFAVVEKGVIVRTQESEYTHTAVSSLGVDRFLPISKILPPPPMYLKLISEARRR